MEPILHEYPRSPSAEKARLAMGLAGLAYRSVLVPSWAPKPDLVPLTGGYRRTPVLQVGADVVCDTLLILRETARLAGHAPDPAAEVMGAALERALFVPAIGVVVGLTGQGYPRALIEDRRGFFGFSLEHRDMLAQQALFAGRLNAHLPRMAAMLADGRPFLRGERPGAADLCAYHPLWHLRRAGGVPEAVAAAHELVPTLALVLRWMDRVAAIGHGQPHPMDPADALDAAQNATPAAFDGNAVPLPGFPLGTAVTVTPDDTGRDKVRGTLVHVSAEAVVLRRADPRVGTVHVHFPRIGFDVEPGAPEETAS